MPRKIVIIGTGYVGLTVGACFAYLGHRVICVDKDKKKIEKLKKGVVPIFEPGLDKILRKYRPNLEFTANLTGAVKEGEVVFIAVGTPSQKDGRINMEHFKIAVREIAKSLNNYKVIVIKSTVPVRTGDWIRREIKKYYKSDFSIVSNPEFLREGSAVDDFLKPDRIVIGVENKKAKAIMLDIYSPIKAPKIITDIKSAELIKYASNAFLATKISFINEIANICEKVGGDVKKVAEGIGSDKRIGKKFLDAGIGYGGSCFPKDIDGLIKIADGQKYNFRLLKTVSLVNENQQKKFIRKIKKILKKNKGNTVCVWGLSFKPNTDDVRKSPAIRIIKQLQRANYKIKAYDPVAIRNAQKILPKKNIKLCKTPLKAVKNSDVLALVTEWPEFLNLDMGKVKSLMKNPYFLDGRNQFKPKALKELGFYYQGIGRK
ncbi:MAG: UDP-glucose dehydrogenase family protein [Candidatus Paceibacterales bacterium]